MQDNGAKKQILQKAILVGLVTNDQPDEQLKEYLDELAFLALTAGVKTEKIFTQRADGPHPKTFDKRKKATLLFEDKFY